MIVTLTPNPALDITYHLPAALRPGQVNRVATVSERAGGKGINVARVLAAHGVPVRALGPVGGATGDVVRALLDESGVAHDLTQIGGVTRRTVAVAGTDAATGLWEPGPAVTATEWRRVRAAYQRALAGADAVVLSGSLPPGVPADAYQALVSLAADAGVPVILDADGEALRLGLRARPTVVKPNLTELSALVDGPIVDMAGAVAAARDIRALGARDVVVTLGSDGLVAVAGDDVWTAKPPHRYSVNDTGAGDAAVAALAIGLAAGEPWPARIARAVGWSAAAAAAAVAGEFHAELAADVAAGIVAHAWSPSA